MTPSKFIQLRNELNRVIDKEEDFVCIIKLMNDNVFGEEVLGNGKKDNWRRFDFVVKEFSCQCENMDQGNSLSKVK